MQYVLFVTIWLDNQDCVLEVVLENGGLGVDPINFSTGSSTKAIIAAESYWYNS
jgi:hypothetical protein